MKRYIIGLILMACCARCQKELPTIIHVNVLSKKFETVTVVDDPATLAELNSIWKTFTVIEPSDCPAFSYIVDVSFTDGTGGRWLYSPEGYMTVLSKAKVPIYTFDRADKLGRILIPQQMSDADSVAQSRTD